MVICKQIALSSGATFLLDNDNYLYASGLNSNGQLGIGTTAPLENGTKLLRVGNKKYNMISAGHNHVGAIDLYGYLWMWGHNAYSQLGDGETATRSSPFKIGSKKWKYLSCGRYYTAAIDEDGYLWMWGHNAYSQLGDGKTATRSSPFKIGSKKWLKVDCCNAHTAAIDEDGYLWAWGNNSDGRVGNGASTEPRRTPQLIGNTKTWKSVSVGNSHTAALDINGKLYVWGNNSDGRLGDGTKVNRTTPELILDNKVFKMLEVGSTFTTAVDEHGQLYVWGYNTMGQLGTGDTTMILTPTMPITKKVTYLAKGSQTNYATTAFIDIDGVAHVAGNNDYGQLCDGTKTISYIYIPIDLQSLSLVVMYLFAVQNNAYTIANGIMQNLGTITAANASTLFANGLETITKEDCILVGQQLGKAKIIKMDV